jgi:hypothetical protein
LWTVSVVENVVDTVGRSEPVVPVDDEALNLLESALDYHFGSEKDENGDPIGVGEFSLYQLLDFWSGYDPALEEAEDGNPHMVTYRGGPLLTTKDVIQALINEVRRLRNGNDAG